MAGGVGDHFKLDDCDKDQFEALEHSRHIWYSFGKSIELMKLDIFNLKKRVCTDKEVEKEIKDIDLNIYNLEKDIRKEYSYLHCLTKYMQLSDRLIWVHVYMNNVSV